jgi:hypothetical protein
MKKLFFAAVILFAVSVNGQDKSKAMNTAKASFAKTFQGVTNVKWSKEGKDLEVDFVQKGIKMSAEYDAKGMLKNTEQSVTPAELPAAVILYINRHYKGNAIKETAKVTTPAGVVYYEIGVKGKDVLFDAKGKFLKEEKD